jgi:hypothetical protein
MLNVPLSGAAVYRCDLWISSAPALAAEVTVPRWKHFFGNLQGFQISQLQNY